MSVITFAVKFVKSAGDPFWCRFKCSVVYQLPCVCSNFTQMFHLLVVVITSPNFLKIHSLFDYLCKATSKLSWVGVHKCYKSEAERIRGDSTSYLVALSSENASW